MKIVSFGELMLRLKPEGLLRFSQADKFEATFGGAEANVAVSLAQLGWDAAYVTKLPAHAIGEMAVQTLRRYGVDTSNIVRGGERVGIYYLEKGYDARASLCVYDRAHSSIATASPDEFDWDEILDGADVFLFTGITTALGQNMVEACRNACETARRKGVKVCCDTNFRATLWSITEAGDTLATLMPYVDMLITNAGVANDMFGLGAATIKDELSDEDVLRDVARRVRERFGCTQVAMTQRKALSSNHHLFQGAIASDDAFGVSRLHDVDVVDRVGGGDAFAAGAILAVCEGMDTQYGAEFAAAASVLAHSIEGDFNLSTRAEVEKTARGGSSGIVR